MRLNDISREVIGAAIEVHRELGPGHDEAAYERALSRELTLRGLAHEVQQPLPAVYKGVKLDCGYRVDLLVLGVLLLELKSVDLLLPIHRAQVLTYLRLGLWKLGLLLNFNEALLKDGLERFVMDFDEEASPVKPRSSQKAASSRPPTPNLTRPAFASGDPATDELTEAVIGAAIEVHRQMGQGLLRSTYEACLARELSLRAVPFEHKKPLALRYKDEELGPSSEVELVVAGRLPLKILSVESVRPVHEAQLLAQMHQGRWPVGLLFNFNVSILPAGIRRCVNPRVKP